MIAITGANGMIGRHLMAYLDVQQQSYKPITRAEWDLSVWQTLAQLDALFDGCEAVFHFAACLPQTADAEDNEAVRWLFDTNVRACMNLAHWAHLRQIPLVFISSATVYADAHAKKITEQAALITSGFGGLYAHSKRLAEEVFAHFAAQGLARIVLRPTSVYGLGLPHDKLVAQYLAQAQAGEVLSVVQKQNRINLIHAADVARGAWQAYQQQAWGVFNLSGQVYTVEQIAQTAIDIANGGQLQAVDSEATAAFLRFDLEGQQAYQTFGFKAQIDLKQGLSLMLSQKEYPC